MVVSKWSLTEGKQVPRKYYEITDVGRRKLVEIKSVWNTISKCITMIMEACNS